MLYEVITRAAEEFFGRPRGELLGRPQSELHPPEMSFDCSLTEDFRSQVANPELMNGVAVLGGDGQRP